MSDKPAVLFVCVHDAGRSQMAAGYLTALGKGQIDVRAAGSMHGDRVNPVAVQAMAEEGIDMVCKVGDDIRGRVETLIGALLPAGVCHP